MNDQRSYCTDCPDRESCGLGHPCDFVRAINDIPERENIMTNVKPTIASIAADATKAANEKAEAAKASAERTAQADAVTEAADLISKAGKKLKSAARDGDSTDETGDGAEATHFVIRIPKFKTFIQNKRNAFIGLGGVAVITTAAIVNFSRSHTVVVGVVKDDDFDVETPEDDFTVGI